MSSIKIGFLFISSVALLPTLEAINDCFMGKGMIVPTYTPVDEYGAVDTSVVDAYAQYLKDVGADGVIVGSTSGEGPTLNVSDNQRLLYAWVKAAELRDLIVFSSVGGVTFPDTLVMSEYSEKLGVDALIILPEPFYKPKDYIELEYYFELIYQAAPNTPLIYDDYPEYTYVEVDIVAFFELATRRIPTFIGVKSNSFRNLVLLRPEPTGLQQLYAANYFYLAPEVCLGFKNFVYSEFNLFPKLILDIIRYRERGNTTRSTILYQRLLNLVEYITISDDLDEEPGPSHQGFWSPASNCTSALSESREKIVAEMARMFDSDDSDQDPTYNSDPGSLIQPEDLFGEQWANNTDENLENIVRFYGDDHYIVEAVQPNDGDVMIEQVLPTTDAHQVVRSLWELIFQGVFDATRKRKRWMKPDHANWKVNIAKKRRSEGLPYSTKQKERSAKIPKEINCEKCFYKCSVISPEERNYLCRHYWSLKYTEQKNFILCNVEVDTPKRVLAIRGPKKQRQFTKRCFFFHNGEKKQVCQKFFCYTLAISPAVVNDAIRKRNDTGLYKDNDKRGKHQPPNKTNEADMNFVKKHIESFPVMEPHYIRKTSKRQYLDASLSIMKMHQLYKEKCTENNMIPVSEITYRRIFCNHYNFSFFVPKKDQCLTCSNFNKASNDEKLLLKGEYEDHLARKESCSSEKAKDKEKAEKDKEFCCVTFDLQAVLQIPSGLVGQLYYCRKLCVYNLCIYEAALPNDAYCFAWSEINGKRGSSEIGSILHHYLSTCVPSHVTEVCLYSDTCGGQNRNQFVAALLLFAVQNISHLRKIEHKFLESGHSYMEVDSMHSSIESAKKNSEVYCMPDYVTIFKRARSKKTITVGGNSYMKMPYQTKEFKFNEFYDLKKLADEIVFNRSKDNDGNQVKWLKIKRMRYLKEERSKIYFNYDMSETFLYIDVSKKSEPSQRVGTRAKKRIDNTTPQTNSIALKQLYLNPLPISVAKKRDLLGLCTKKIIPEEYHGWYSSLLTVTTEVDRLPEPSVDEESSED